MHAISTLHTHEGKGSCCPDKGTKGYVCPNPGLHPGTPNGLNGALGCEAEVKGAMDPVFPPTPLRKRARFMLPSPPTPSLPSGSGLALPAGPGWRRSYKLS